VRGVIPSLTFETSRLKVPGSMSTKTGVAPTREIDSAVAKKVKGVVITSSPGPIPRASSVRTRASVPLATPTPWAAPQRAATSSSRACTSGPRIYRPPSNTPSTAFSTSSRIDRYWAFRSIKGIFIGGCHPPFWDWLSERIKPHRPAESRRPIAGDRQLQGAPSVLPGDFRPPAGPDRFGHVLDDAPVTGHSVRILFHAGNGCPGFLLRQVGKPPGFDPVGRRASDHRRSLLAKNGEGLLQVPGVDRDRRLDHPQGSAFEAKHRHGSVLRLDPANPGRLIGGDLFHLAQEPQEQIQIVNGLIHQDAAVHGPGPAPGRLVIVGLVPVPANGGIGVADGPEGPFLHPALKFHHRRAKA